MLRYASCVTVTCAGRVYKRSHARAPLPAPWTVEEYRGISYIVRDANRFAVAHVYFEPEPGRRAAASLMTKDEARKIAAASLSCRSWWGGRGILKTKKGSSA